MKYIFCLVGLFVSLGAFAQSITITGKMTDAHTEEPIPFGSVYVPGSTIGTTSDMDGNYKLTLQNRPDTLVGSCIGYEKVKISPSSAPNQTINFQLDRKASLKEVVIHAGENPALIVLRRVQRNKISNNKDKLSSYSYEVYNKLEVDLNKINNKMENNKILKPFNFVYNYIDSTSEDKPYLPMYLTESLSDYYYRKNPKATKEVIKASRLAGGENESISQFLGTMYQDVNIYDSRMNLMGVDFISPIANSGTLFYRYEMIDTNYIDGRLCYQISFSPKRAGENTFVGDMWINDTSWAVKRISMTVAKGANVNFVSRVSIYQDYIPVNDSIWLSKKEKFIVDFISAKKDAPGLTGRKTTSFKNYKVNVASIDTVFKDKLDIVLQDNSGKRNEEYWNTVRHDSLSRNEKNIYKLVDTIQKVPAFKHYSQLFTTLGTGYYVKNYFEYGPYYDIYARNHVEGHRLGFGGRTSNLFSTKLMLSAFVAYGIADKKLFKDSLDGAATNKLKYDISALYVFNKLPRCEAKLRYLNDVVTYNQLDEELGENNLFSAFARRVPSPSKLVGNEETTLYFLKEWKLGIGEKISYRQSFLHPYFYNPFVNPQPGQRILFNPTPYFVNSEVSLTTRFAWHEKFIAGEFLRSSIGSDYPIVSLELRQGLKGVLNSQFSYTKARLQLDDNFRTGVIGDCYYSLVAEKTWGTLPVVLLGVLPGNDTYYYDKYAFNNMNRYEFVADEYVTLRVNQYFGGFPFSLIPLMKKLKWRSFVGGRAAIGNMSEANRKANLYYAAGPTPWFGIPNKGPYTELSCGIENIFKVLRLDFVWRLNYLNKTLYPLSSPLGLKFSFQVEF